MFLALADRVAVVTGGAKGIGFSIARRLQRAGAHVVIVDRDRPAAEAAVASLPEGSATAFLCDVSSVSSVESMFATVREGFGGIDVLINNAGVTGRSVPLWELKDDDWRTVLGVDLDGVFYCSRAVIAGMRERRRGSIVNVASIAGKEGNPNLIPYSVAKAGVIALTKALAKEVVDDGIRVNAVAPGLIETEILSQMTPETVAALTARIPMGRLGTVEEVAAVVHFLASDDASFVTGQCYDVSGGRAT
ncbi:MAG: SDR family oxidoreductase, partial [Candidatus Eremiobacteraeota bacterium]|nr:SDR family oxidoreductase [Candidatus Eremiobacteraeota bacterium]